MPASYTEEFENALQRSIDEFNIFDELRIHEDDDPQLTSVGVEFEDILLLTGTLYKSHYDDIHSDDWGRSGAAMVSIVTIALLTGIYLERQRTDEFERTRPQ
jgi:hypothetical protein